MIAEMPDIGLTLSNGRIVGHDSPEKNEQNEQSEGYRRIDSIHCMSQGDPERLGLTE